MVLISSDLIFHLNLIWMVISILKVQNSKRPFLGLRETRHLIVLSNTSRCLLLMNLAEAASQTIPSIRHSGSLQFQRDPSQINRGLPSSKKVLQAHSAWNGAETGRWLFWTDERLPQAGRDPCQTSGASQACRRRFLLQRPKAKASQANTKSLRPD